MTQPRIDQTLSERKHAMGAATKAELEALLKRSERSLARSEAKNVTLGKSLDRARARNKSLTNSLHEAKATIVDLGRSIAEGGEREKATAEILRVISSSLTSAQPVFDAIVKSGLSLFQGSRVSLSLVRDGWIEPQAAAETDMRIGVGSRFKLDGDIPIGACILGGRMVHVPDMGKELERFPRMKERSIAVGLHSALCVPLVRDGKAFGAIAVRRTSVGAFSEQEMSLLRTFADQAVIAIENVRLFKELEARNAELTESLEQQTVTSEILRIISRSPTDTQPVFDAIVKSGSRLLGGHRVVLRLVKENQVVNVARSNGNVGNDLNANSLTDEDRPDVRAILRREVVDVPDYLHAEPWVSERAKKRAAHMGRRANTHAPLLARDKAIGAIAVDRANPGALTDKQIALLRTFADQAVIAIENVRLFKELQTRNAELAEALERQTATAQILRVISGSPTDLQPVFDAILGNALRLCDAHMGHLGLYDGEMYQYVAQRGANAEYARFLSERGRYRPLGPLGRMVAEGQHVHLADATDTSEYRDGRPGVVAMVELGGGRTFLAVPMLKEGRVVGGISIYRPEVRPFTQRQIELVIMFADQAVIAIENVRLFKELQARNAEVTEAPDQQTATAEILRVISSSPTDLRPVFGAILEKATQLCDSHLGALGLYDGEIYQIVAARARNAEVEKWILERGPLRPTLDGMLSRVLHSGQPTQTADLRESVGYKNRRPMAVQMVERVGVRSQLGVPMLKDGRAVGNIGIFRTEVRPFTQKEIDVVSTFANQAVIAIENVRMFNEIRDKSRQLEIANQHKSEFLANMSHELRTPLNAVIGFSEVLQQGMVGELNEKQDEYLKYIHASGSHLLSLINDILDLSKVEAGRMELDLSSFNVPLAIDNALTLVKERAARHGLELDGRVDPAVADIRADERKFKQILLNLLSNAVKFTPEGGSITVAARPLGGMLEVSVTDTGIGIAPEDCEAVFEEFRQVGEHAEGKAEGTGLGLALTKKFIELHGGRIWLTSTPGKGSTFSFTLPIHQPEVQATA